MRTVNLLPGGILFLTTLLAPIACSSGTPEAAPGNAVAQREDIAAFERDFFARDRSYSPETRVLAKRRLEALTRDAGSVSDTLFILTLSQIVALADNGHSAILYRGSAPELGRVGIRLAPFGQDFVALQAIADQAALLGGRLVAIDDTPIAKLREVAHTLTGGVAPRRDLMAPLLLESPGQLHALGLARPPDAIRAWRRRPGCSRNRALDRPEAVKGPEVPSLNPYFVEAACRGSSAGLT